MQKDGVFDGNFERAGICNGYSLNININFNSDFLAPSTTISGAVSEDVMDLFYSGKINSGHYDALLPMSTGNVEMTVDDTEILG
jgi:hypothetical protein